MKVTAILVGAVCFLGLIGWWEYAMWAECRADHSFFYCLRVLNK